MGSGPKLVVIGSIFGSIFLALFLSVITAGFSYTAALSAGGEKALAQNQEPEDKAIEQDPTTGGITVDNSGAKGDCAVSSRFPESILQWCGLNTHYAAQNGLSPDLVAALIWQESGGKPAVYSRSGAVGLMQVMPSDGVAASFMCINGPCFSDRPTGKQLEDPEFNIAFGTKYLARQVNRTGNLRDALKSYGPMDVGYYYADKVLNLFTQYGQ